MIHLTYHYDLGIKYWTDRPSTFSNIFSPETSRPIKLIFHMETPEDKGIKVCSNGPGHMS